jgi:hypothetical protein
VLSGVNMISFASWKDEEHNKPDTMLEFPRDYMLKRGVDNPSPPHEDVGNIMQLSQVERLKSAGILLPGTAFKGIISKNAAIRRE